MAVHYRPILQAHKGELDALSDIGADTWRRMTPVLEMAPNEQESWARASTTFRIRLAGSYQDGMRLGVDAPLGGHGTSGRAEVLADLVRVSRDVVSDVLPVLCPTDLEAVLTLRTLGIRLDGLILRLRPADLRLPAAQLAGMVEDLLAVTRVPRSVVDLLVDMGPLPASTFPDQLHSAVVRTLRGSGWRSRTLVSGAFPRYLPRVDEQWQLVEIPRRDELLWRHVRAELGPAGADLDYGDYAATHPVPSAGGRAAPHLRYAVDGRWLVVRGRRFQPQEFFEVCRRVGAHPEFTGRLGAADEQIARRAREGPHGVLTCGNSTTWKELSTAHHLEFVVRQLDR